VTIVTQSCSRIEAEVQVLGSRLNYACTAKLKLPRDEVCQLLIINSILFAALIRSNKPACNTPAMIVAEERRM
jgi:hypothetical protein